MDESPAAGALDGDDDEQLGGVVGAAAVLELDDDELLLVGGQFGDELGELELLVGADVVDEERADECVDRDDEGWAGVL